MDIIEAEQFFKQYCGLEFHMGREEPKKYNSYRELNTSDEQKTLIIENIGERGYDLISIALKYESCGKRLEAVMDKIIASCHTDNESNEQCERYQNAVYNYQAIL